MKNLSKVLALATVTLLGASCGTISDHTLTVEHLMSEQGFTSTVTDGEGYNPDVKIETGCGFIATAEIRRYDSDLGFYPENTYLWVYDKGNGINGKPDVAITPEALDNAVCGD